MMRGHRFLIFMLLSLMAVLSVQAQTDREHIRDGNRYFHSGDYAKAEVEYRKALEKNSENAQAMYNLANAMVIQKDNASGDDAKNKKRVIKVLQLYHKADSVETNHNRRARINHNIGVLFQSNKDYATAINYYKESLRNNPKDNETRYNLALCQKLLKNGGGNNNKNDKNKKNKDDNKDKNNKENKQNKDKNKDKKQNQLNNQDKNQMSKDNAKQLLNAAIQEEKATQNKMKKAQAQPRSRRLEKNW